MKMTLGLILTALVSISVPAVHATDWPHLRGPEIDGRVQAPGTFDGDEVGLDLAWSVPLGSGYSGIAVSGDRAVTMYAGDEADWVVAFDASTGKSVWRYRLGDLTKGHDGSDDGPLSSPVIGNEIVFALAPNGRLVALRLNSGDVVWQKQLEQEFEAKPPHFGFATTPLFDSGLLVVQTGAPEGTAILGLDAKSGKKLWSRGDGEVNYQSPAVMTLAGQRQIVAVSKKGITGLAATSGDVLWVHEFGEGDRGSSANPTFIGDDRFLVLMSGGATVFRVARAETEFKVEEVYRTQALGQNYSPPVYHDGHLYGFRGQVLTCADASTGERVWRSRPPGGDGLILVDGHLVIFGAAGNVVVAEATPEGYREKVRLQALDGSGLTWPSFASGRVYVRNLEALAAVSVTRSGTTAPAVAAATMDGEFDRWLDRLRASDDPEAKIDAFFEEHAESPVTEGDRVHFLIRADAADVAIAGSMIDSESIEPMHHVEGTDLFYQTYRLEPGARWEYNFQVDFETWMPDPRNPRSVPAVEGDHELSEFVAEGYVRASHFEEPEGPRGRVDNFTLPSEILEYDKQIKVWLPPGYDGGDEDYPLLVVNDGIAWLDRGLMANSLDNLVGKLVAPVVVAFIEPTRRWWLEAGGSRTEEYARMQVEELIPALERRYRLVVGPASRGIMGNRFFGLATAYAALEYPDVFGLAAIQSVFLGLGAGEDVEALVGAGAGKSVRFYVDWNRFDERRRDRGYDFAEDSRRLAEMLNAAGYTTLGGEVLDSRGWGGSRNRTDQVLVALFLPSSPLERLWPVGLGSNRRRLTTEDRHDLISRRARERQPRTITVVDAGGSMEPLPCEVSR